MLLIRVLTPEAAVLRLHFHEHTNEEPTTSLTATADSKAVLSAEHQHCHVEQLYDAPFQHAGAPYLQEHVQLLSYATYRPEAPVCRASHLLAGASLRGPPAARA